VSVEIDTHVHGLCALEQLTRNEYKEAEKQQLFAQKVQQQNTTLNSQLELYKEKGSDIIRDLEKQRDKLDLAVVTNYKRKNEELQKNVDLILKLGNSLQGMFMLGPKPFLSNSEIPLDVRDTEDTLDEASKSQQKMKQKMNDSIAVANKQNCCRIDYKQINALYKDFVPQKELFAEQKYFSSSFIPSDKTSQATSSITASMLIAVYVRKNKQTDNTSANVISNKENVIVVDVANASKAKTLLCVACMQNVLIPCHDKCLANYKLNVHSKVRRALFTTPKTAKSTFEYTTPIVSKTRFSVKTTQSDSLDTTSVVSRTNIVAVTPLRARNKVASVFKSISVILQDNSLSKYMKNKIRTS
ncbi:hypothetical protein Tco_1454172, partial [Tanacetum coccineum]